MTKSKLVKTDSFKVLCENLTNYLEECFKESKQNKTQELLLSIEQPIKNGLELGFSFTKMARLITEAPFMKDAKIGITPKQLKEFCEKNCKEVTIQKEVAVHKDVGKEDSISDNKQQNTVPDSSYDYDYAKE